MNRMENSHGSEKNHVHTYSAHRNVIMVHAYSLEMDKIQLGPK